MTDKKEKVTDAFFMTVVYFLCDYCSEFGRGHCLRMQGFHVCARRSRKGLNFACAEQSENVVV